MRYLTGLLSTQKKISFEATTAGCCSLKIFVQESFLACFLFGTEGGWVGSERHTPFGCLDVQHHQY